MDDEVRRHLAALQAEGNPAQVLAFLRLWRMALRNARIMRQLALGCAMGSTNAESAEVNAMLAAFDEMVAWFSAVGGRLAETGGQAEQVTETIH